MKKAENLIKMMKVGKDVHSTFVLLQKHASDDPTRYFMTYPRYFHEKKELVATDGRRLMIIDVSKFSDELQAQFPQEDCLLEATKDNVFFYKLALVGDSFPNYERVTPDLADYITNGKEYNLAKPTKKNCFAGYNVDIPKLFFDTGITVNLRYLTDLQDNDILAYIHRSYKERQNKAVVVTFGAVKVVIMPFQYDSNNKLV